MKNNCNILVTGCAGFIGSRVCKLLLDCGHVVVGIDNLNSFYSLKIKEYRISKLNHLGSNFNFFKCSVTNKTQLNRLVNFRKQRFNAIIHLAALAGVRESINNPLGFVDTNVKGTINMLELCNKFKIPKLVVASSSSVYGNTSHESSEDSDVNKPISVYASTKKSVEEICYTYHYLFGLDISVLRYFTCYGEAGRPDMSIWQFIEAIKNDKVINVYGDGKQQRDYTYVDDIAEGTIKALKPLGYEIINLGNNNPVEINYVISLIEKELGKKAKIKYVPRNKADVLINYANINKAKQLLDWQPKVSIEEGIKRTVAWHINNKEQF